MEQEKQQLNQQQPHQQQIHQQQQQKQKPTKLTLPTPPSNTTSEQLRSLSMIADGIQLNSNHTNN
jgi:hypothetical protein